MNANMPPLSRREMLRRTAHGFGWLAFAGLYGQRAEADSTRAPHFPARARNVILLFMDGGVSHVDTFDPKPRLARENGQPFGQKMDATQFDNNGSVLASPWDFKRYGQSGTPVSDLFPHLGGVADELCVIR